MGEKMFGPVYNLLQEGKVGTAEIRRRTIPEDTVLQSWDEINGMHQIKFAGDYESTELHIDGEIWMSDTPLEQNTAMPFMQMAEGSVLLGGLGIGLVPSQLMVLDRITSITIIENSIDVIELVGQSLNNDKIEIIEDDIRNYLISQGDDGNGRRFDSVFIDIWEDMGTPRDEIEEMMDLAEKVLTFDGFASCWLQSHYDLIRSKIPTAPTVMSGFGKFDPCFNCGKTLRADYSGLCMDCADSLMVSELWVSKT